MLKDIQYLKIESQVIFGRYFVTSEQDSAGQTMFSVRMMKDNGSIELVGELSSHDSKHQALEVIRKQIALISK